MTTFVQDPQAVLDHKWDWTAWLDSGETISSAIVTADPGITVAPSGKPNVIADKTVTVWVTGGSAGTKYGVACRITTSAGRVDERTRWITIQNR